MVERQTAALVPWANRSEGVTPDVQRKSAICEALENPLSRAGSCSRPAARGAPGPPGGEGGRISTALREDRCVVRRFSLHGFCHRGVGCPRPPPRKAKPMLRRSQRPAHHPPQARKDRPKSGRREGMVWWFWPLWRHESVLAGGLVGGSVAPRRGPRRRLGTAGSVARSGRAGNQGKRCRTGDGTATSATSARHRRASGAVRSRPLSPPSPLMAMTGYGRTGVSWRGQDGWVRGSVSRRMRDEDQRPGQGTAAGTGG